MTAPLVTAPMVTALRADRLLPGDGAPMVSPAMLLVADGRIMDIDGTGAAAPAGAEVVDLGDITLLPGLVDAHTHLCFDSSSEVLPPLLNDTDEVLLERMAANARTALAAGITTVRDLGDRRFLSLALREESDPAALPELLLAGPPITRSQGHCWFLGGEAEGTEALRAAVQERASRGCDVVKVMATGGVITPGFLPADSQYGVAELTAIVEEAAKHGLPVASHGHGREGIAASLAAGVSSIEHCSFLTAEGQEVDWQLVEQIAAAGVFVGLTIATAPSDLTPPPIVVRMLAALPEFIGGMRAAGVKVVCSSDAGIAPPKPHNVLTHGVVTFAGCGFTNQEAIDSATSLAADACGVGSRKGRLRPGYDADVLAVRGDPLRDITALHDVVAVFRAGRRVDAGS